MKNKAGWLLGVTRSVLRVEWVGATPLCEKEYTDKGPSLILGASTINVVRPMKDIL